MAMRRNGCWYRLRRGGTICRSTAGVGVVLRSASQLRMRVGGLADRLGIAVGRQMRAPVAMAGNAAGTAAWVPQVEGVPHDESLSRLFQDARSYMQLTREDLAHRLGTTAGVIAAFEAGAISAFPSWAETRRVVEGYAALVDFDPRALLGHIETRMNSRPPLRPLTQMPVPVPAPVQIQTAPVRSTKGSAQPTGTPHAQRSGGLRRHRVVVAVGAAVIIGAIGFYWAAFSRPAALMTAVRALPSPIATPIRAAMDGLVAVTAPRRDGLRWIEVEDPRTRKADKLPTSNQ
jgi:DNA-binding XRE family transcriptional regulator